MDLPDHLVRLEEEGQYTLLSPVDPGLKAEPRAIPESWRASVGGLAARVNQRMICRTPAAATRKLVDKRVGPVYLRER